MGKIYYKYQNINKLLQLLYSLNKYKLLIGKIEY